MLGKQVLIRSYAAGVHFGELVSENFTPAGKVVTLKNSRRVWSWTGAASLSQIASDGLPANGQRISVTVASIEVVNVIETIPLSESAIKSLANVPEWKV